MHVIDTSAILLRKAVFDEMLTVPEVIEEVKDDLSKLYLEVISLRVEPAVEEYVLKVVRAAERTGDIYKLSDTDVKVLAKALEYGAVLVSDDYAVQNVARALGLRVESVLQPGIKKEFKWIRVCRGCGRKTRSEICEICGSETRLKRVVKK
ncbi:NOB1 family endonuclease [Geoglobus sp.]